MKRTKEHKEIISNSKKGIPRSNETKSKISKKLKNRIFSEETKLKMSNNRPKKSIIQFTINNIKINEFNSIKEAGISIGLRIDSISNCCRGTQKTSGGFIWKFKNGQPI